MIETTRVPGYRDHAVSLTKDGRSLLESHRDHVHEHSQTFYAGLGRERELEHDLQVYRAYEQAEDRLLDRGAHLERVVLDHELKSEYQRWLHERDKDHDDYDGHPEFVAEIVESFPVCYPLTELSVIRHEPDNRFLECALAANAEFIVTVKQRLGTSTGSSIKRRTSRDRVNS